MPRTKDWAPPKAEGKPKGKPPEMPQWFCSSKDFDTMIREKYPELVVPEHDCVYIGLSAPSQYWDEMPPKPGEPCPRCERDGAPERGSQLLCPKCQASGFERKLFEQRRLAGYPPAHVEKPAPKKQPPATAPAKNAPGEDRKQKMWRNYAWENPRLQTPSHPQPRPEPSSSTREPLPAA